MPELIIINGMWCITVIICVLIYVKNRYEN